MKDDGRKILEDGDAKSANPALPAFLARPEGAPVYHGFPLVPESDTDGWVIGAITKFENPEGSDGGDAFVVAPDGSRAGLVWEVGSGPVTEVYKPEHDRWGVYLVYFPRIVRTLDDFVEGFRAVLPDLKTIHARLRNAAG